jgi:hypothetical protein
MLCSTLILNIALSTGVQASVPKALPQDNLLSGHGEKKTGGALSAAAIADDISSTLLQPGYAFSYGKHPGAFDGSGALAVNRTIDMGTGLNFTATLDSAPLQNAYGARVSLNLKW